MIWGVCEKMKATEVNPNPSKGSNVNQRLGIHLGTSKLKIVAPKGRQALRGSDAKRIIEAM